MQRVIYYNGMEDVMTIAQETTEVAPRYDVTVRRGGFASYDVTAHRANGIACPYCGKPIETPVQRRIIARPPRGTMTFCSEACGGYYQMGCEG